MVKSVSEGPERAQRAGSSCLGSLARRNDKARNYAVSWAAWMSTLVGSTFVGMGASRNGTIFLTPICSGEII